MVEGDAMHALEFRGDDAGYLAWLAAHPAGYVVNISKNYGPADARMHRASCSALRNQTGALTDHYVKVCADEPADLQRWAFNHVGQESQPCGRCSAHPRVAGATPAMESAPATAAPLAGGEFFLPPPTPGSSVVEAWADDYIHYKPRPEWQSLL